MADVWHAGTSLRQWRLHNFKSVRDALVDLAPLTVVVGENSAGKSSLLQSIRAVVQAGDATGSAFPLNGDQLRLGTYDETRSAGAPDNDPQIGIGGVFRVGDDHAYRPQARRTRRKRPVPPGADPTTMDWEIRLGGSPAEQPGQTILRSCSMTLISGGRSQVLGSKDASRGRDADPDYQGSYSREDGTQALIHVEHRGGFAVRGYVDVDLVRHLADTWIEIAELLALRAMRENIKARKPGARELARAAADDIRAAIGDDDASDGRALHERRLRLLLHERLSARPPFDLEALLAARDQIPPLADALVSVRRRLSKEEPLDEDMTDAVAAVQDFLARRVLHLGPLRMDPQVVYTAAPTGRSGYIGNKGEYCAAVLHSNGRSSVHVPLPGQKSLAFTPLSHAVDRWAATLGIGEQFTTADKGRLGLELGVRQPNVGIALDLTSVGTGVSQLLPVLVMCLQAPAGSLLLLEQPELHLNPAVQQRLADFLLAIAASGRQLIVETHSDYLVSRLRRRIAEDTTGRTVETVSVVFAERSATGTSYAPIRLAADGSLPGWPSGFFDQAAEDAEATLRAAMRKSLGGLPPL